MSKQSVLNQIETAMSKLQNIASKIEGNQLQEVMRGLERVRTKVETNQIKIKK